MNKLWMVIIYVYFLVFLKLAWYWLTASLYAGIGLVYLAFWLYGWPSVYDPHALMQAVVVGFAAAIIRRSGRINIERLTWKILSGDKNQDKDN